MNPRTLISKSFDSVIFLSSVAGTGLSQAPVSATPGGEIPFPGS